MSNRLWWIKEGLPGLVVWTSFLLIAGTFCWILGDLMAHGVGLINWQFLTTAPRSSGRAGGIGPILVSTLAIVSICLLASVPIGLGTALFLSEFTASNRPFARLVRVSLDILAGVPSIVFGLFGNVLFCQVLGLGFSLLSGGLTLACMVLPLLIRTAEEGLRGVPHDYRMGAAALGLSRLSTLSHIILPAASPALVVGFALGLGRALAETAALIFTSGYVDRMPTSMFDSGRALTLHIFDLAMNVAGGDDAAYRSALVLVGLLLILNLGASILTRLLAKSRNTIA